MADKHSSDNATSANEAVPGEWDKFRAQKPPVRSAPPSGADVKKPRRGLSQDEIDLTIVAIVLAVLLLVGAAVFFSGALDSKKESKKDSEITRERYEERYKESTEGEEDAEGADGDLAAQKPVYYALPEVLVNLASTTRRTKFLKMSVTLELHEKKSAAIVEANSPRIMDAFNTYLRGVEPQELSGSAGIVRLREELMMSINGIIGEGVVKNVLFNEITVQ